MFVIYFHFISLCDNMYLSNRAFVIDPLHRDIPLHNHCGIGGHDTTNDQSVTREVM